MLTPGRDVLRELAGHAGGVPKVGRLGSGNHLHPIASISVTKKPCSQGGGGPEVHRTRTQDRLPRHTFISTKFKF
jgi:hypothetical protein